MTSEPGPNAPETLAPLRISSERLIKIYGHCGIPEKYCGLQFDSLETTGRAEPLWSRVRELSETWVNGNSPHRGLLMAGGQGTGKSAALFLSARAAIKSYLRVNDPGQTGFPNVPIWVREFPEWLRFEFCPKDDRHRWNFDSLYEITNSRAIFFDEMTFDARSDAFKPVAEFFYLMVNRLCNMETPPPLYISTNNTASDWAKLFGSNLVDRLIGDTHGLCEIKKCDWKSFR